MSRRTLTYSCLAALMVAEINCTTHIVSRSEPTLVASRALTETSRLEVLSEPTSLTPVASFRSLHSTSAEETYRCITVVKRKPVFLGEMAILGGAAAAFLLANDMQKKGFPQYARPTLAVAGAAVATVFIGRVLSLFNWSRAVMSRNTVHTAKPVPIRLLSSGNLLATLQPDGKGLATFDLREHTESFGDVRQDLKLTAEMQGVDSCSRQFVVTPAMLASAVSQHRAEVARQEREAREQRLALERAAREEQERKAQAAAAVAAALDNVVRSLSDWDRTQFATALMYAQAGFQCFVVERCTGVYGIKTYGDFLDLPLRSQVDLVRKLTRIAGGEGYGASMVLQSLLEIPAYLAEKILK